MMRGGTGREHREEGDWSVQTHRDRREKGGGEGRGARAQLHIQTQPEAAAGSGRPALAPVLVLALSCPCPRLPHSLMEWLLVESGLGGHVLVRPPPPPPPTPTPPSTTSALPDTAAWPDRTVRPRPFPACPLSLSPSRPLALLTLLPFSPSPFVPSPFLQPAAAAGPRRPARGAPARHPRPAPPSRRTPPWRGTRSCTAVRASATALPHCSPCSSSLPHPLPLAS